MWVYPPWVWYPWSWVWVFGGYGCGSDLQYPRVYPRSSLNTTIINSKPLETSVHYILTKMWHGNQFLYEFGDVMIVG